MKTLFDENIIVGYKAQKKDQPYFIYPKNRSTHMQIIGSTGTGKSKFLEYLIREDIKRKNGLCLIDPHGYLYNDLVSWCESKRMFGKRDIILFDPSQEGWSFGFNPFKIDSVEISYHVDKMVQAVAQVWGGEDTNKTPLLKRNLRMIFHVLAEKKLSLLESIFLLDSTDSTVRKYLTMKTTDPIIQKLWNYANLLKPRPFMDEFGSAVNRMIEFLSSPIVKNTVGSINYTIDLKKVMDEGGILLVNLAAKDKLSDDNARLLGTLIVNDLFMKCRGRADGSRPFYLYIDECGRYINDDIARILDEGRKFGLHLILAHQHLAQLEDVSRKVYLSVLTDAKAKVVFGGLTAEDARVLAENIFAGEIELQEVKEVLNKPVTIGHVKQMIKSYGENESQSTGTSQTRTKSYAESYSQGESEGKSRGTSIGMNRSDGSSWQNGVTFDTELGIIERSKNFSQTVNSVNGFNKGKSQMESQSFQKSRSWSEGESLSEGESYQTTTGSSWGESETFVPILEERPSSTYSLEEQIQRAMWVMMNQNTQYAIIKLAGCKSQAIKTPKVESSFANKQRIQRFKTATFQKDNFVQLTEEREKIIAERMAKITEEAEEYAIEQPTGKPKKKDPKSFRG